MVFSNLFVDLRYSMALSLLLSLPALRHATRQQFQKAALYCLPLWFALLLFCWNDFSFGALLIHPIPLGIQYYGLVFTILADARYRVPAGILAGLTAFVLLCIVATGNPWWIFALPLYGWFALLYTCICKTAAARWRKKEAAYHAAQQPPTD